MMTSVQMRVFLTFAAGYFLSYLYRTVNAVLSPDLTRDPNPVAGRFGTADLGLFHHLRAVPGAARVAAG